MTSNIYVPPNWIDPLDWRQVFDQQRPVEIDVGCGKGAFLHWVASTRPSSNFIGVDRLLARLRKVDKRIQRHGLHNVRLIRIEASYLISKLVPNSSVAAYHVYFPDPWPKRRHRERRLINTALVKDLHRTLEPRGAVNVATDHDDYFQQIESVMSESDLFQRETVEAQPEEARTDFEREFLADGKPIYRSRWVRRGSRQ